MPSFYYTSPPSTSIAVARYRRRRRLRLLRRGARLAVALAGVGVTLAAGAAMVRGATPPSAAEGTVAAAPTGGRLIHAEHGVPLARCIALLRHLSAWLETGEPVPVRDDPSAWHARARLPDGSGYVALACRDGAMTVRLLPPAPQQESRR